MFDVEKSDRNVELFVFDIFVAILKIRKVAGKFDNPQDMLYAFESWDSVMREFLIIGEASRYLIKSSLLDKEHQVIVDFRNKIIHEYFGIEPDIVWAVVNEDIPKFENTIKSVIAGIEPDLKRELIDAFIEDNRYLEFVVEALRKL